MKTETEPTNLRIWGGPIVAVIQPKNERNNGSAAKVTISYDDQNDHYRLECDDLVANVWVETFENLSLALARMALLARCGEENWNSVFRFDADDASFTNRAKAFFREQTG